MTGSVNFLFLIGAFLFFLPSSYCQNWNEPAFLSAGGEPFVNLTNLPGVGAIISKYEEMEPPIRIAEINYNGEGTIYLRVLAGDIDLLGPIIVNEGGRYYVDITERQDYENPAMNYYQIQVEIQDAPTISWSTIFLNIVNVDDK